LIDFNVEDLSPWMLRIVLDEKFVEPRVLADPNFSLDDIGEKITKHFNDSVHVICSDNNSTNGYVLRLRILMRQVRVGLRKIPYVFLPPPWCQIWSFHPLTHPLTFFSS
jgi:hypothetical protein